MRPDVPTDDDATPDDARHPTRGRRTFLAACDALGITNGRQLWATDLADLTRAQRDALHERWYALMAEAVGRHPNARLNQSTKRPDRNAQVCEAYKAGDDAVILAHRFGVTAQRIRQILISNGVERRSMSEAMKLRFSRPWKRPGVAA